MTAEREVALRLVGVNKTHGEGATAVTALTDVDLDVARGELVALMGPSGSGKSTLLNIAGGLDSPDVGEVTVMGRRVDTADVRERARLRRQQVGYVFQDYNLVAALTAVENVALPRELDGARARRARRQAMEALDAVGIADLAQRYPDDMSGGQRQRVAIARALVGPRSIVLADEPTGALDSVTGEEVMAILRARVDAGAAGLLVTHEPRFAAWADRTVFLRDGRVVDATRPAGDVTSLLVTDR